MTKKQPFFQVAIMLTFLMVLFPILSLAATFEGEMIVDELQKKNFKSTRDLGFMIKERLIWVLMPYSNQISAI